MAKITKTHSPSEDDVEYVVRPGRKWVSRVVSLPKRPSSVLTVIAGPGEGDEKNDTVLYTVYGGYCAPREPGDTSLDWDGIIESRKFWAEHALAKLIS